MDIFEKYVDLQIRLLEKELEFDKYSKDAYSFFYQNSDTELLKELNYTMFKEYQNRVDILIEKINILKEEKNDFNKN